MIVLFTDFGLDGPYTGQVKAVLYGLAPAVPVIDLFADAPAHRPREAAYLLAAYADAAVFVRPSVFLAVIDPGVGGDRAALALHVDGHWFVGPDNGLFEPVVRRGGIVQTYRIAVPGVAPSASFHARDVFAPVAARLAMSGNVRSAGLTLAGMTRFPDWPDDHAAIVYVDRFGNLLTGLRAALIPPAAQLVLGGRPLPRCRTFSDVSPGQAFWYENANGLAEIAVNCGRADALFGCRVGDAVTVVT
jgi:hypothetical protein